MPPMITMTKVSITAFGAMPSEAVTSGAASTPPMPARPQPMPNTAERTRRTSVPRACTISAFCDGGADQQAQPRALQELPDGDRDHNAGAGQEQAVDRERLVEDEDDAGKCRWRRDLERVDAPDRRIASPMISVRPNVTIRKALWSRR